MKKSFKIFTAIFATIGLIVFIVIIGIILVINHNKNMITISGPAMEPTLKSGQKVTLVTYTQGQTPARGDIIDFGEKGLDAKGNPKNDKLILRIIGMPGDHFTVVNSQVKVFNNQYPNGFNPDALYASGTTGTLRDLDITLGSNQYFVLGDNLSNSLDSRIFGPIEASQIIGKIKP